MPADPLIVRYAAALRSAAKAAASSPVHFDWPDLDPHIGDGGRRATAADDLAAAFDLALRAQGCHDAGAIPGLWYVNLAYFTGPVHDAQGLIDWVEARRTMRVADLQIARMQIVRWQYTATGMVPIRLAALGQR